MIKLLPVMVLFFANTVEATVTCDPINGSFVNRCWENNGVVNRTAGQLPIPPPQAPPKYIPASTGEDEQADERLEIGVFRLGEGRSPSGSTPQAIK